MDARSSLPLGSAAPARAVYGKLPQMVLENKSVSPLREMRATVPPCPAKVSGLLTLAASSTGIFGGSNLLGRNVKPDLRPSSSLQPVLTRVPSSRQTERKSPSIRIALGTMRSGRATAMAPAAYRLLHW